MPKELLNDIFLIKDVTIKTLVSGDKSARITLETLTPETVNSLKNIINKLEVKVVIYE